MTSDTGLTLKKSFSVSKILAGMPYPTDGDDARISDFVNTLDKLAYSVAIFFFAALNAIPAPPGTSLFLGIPLVILAMLKVLGASLWLPAFIMRAQVTRARYKTSRESLLKLIRRIERHVGPRGRWHKTPIASKTLDVVTLGLSLCVLIPLPFTAILPAVSICVITLGRMEKDGRCIAVGLIMGASAAVICSTMIYGSGRLIALIFGL